MNGFSSNSKQRLKVTVRGAVQGVGFRPFVYRLATDLGLPGWVSNSTSGVFIEVEGFQPSLERFLLRLDQERPPRSSIQSLEFSYLDAVGHTGFEIRSSSTDGSRTALVLPDIATCPECLHELFDQGDRRFRYPFTNCTNCGPRFSIITSLPYDRSRTSMHMFQMCELCRREYEEPLNRRFHAQPNACPSCGPHLELWDRTGTLLSSHDDALRFAAAEILRGNIVAVKGLGGFHLMVHSGNEEAVRRLRNRKHREEKPFAVMYPTLDTVRRDCIVSSLEERLLRSPESPIVLLRRREGHRTSVTGMAMSVAPGNPYLGIFLPYTPLHSLLLAEVNHPVVATSGNLSDEPICTDEREALDRLGGIADCFLVHNRPIVRHVDDSIVRVMLDRELVVRRARGYAPLPLGLRPSYATSILAVGAHLKNSIALSSGENVFVSQHIGDLETRESLDAFHAVISDFQRLFDVAPGILACDLHPDYLSSQFGRSTGLPLEEIQHHYAHVASCMAENELEGELLGISWDGTGYGPDGHVWGGEFLITTDSGYRRVAALSDFPLPGGEQAIREPRRSALGVLYELYGEGVLSDPSMKNLLRFSDHEVRILRQTLERGINTPRTTSVGRLFDAVASLLGCRDQVNFEGQAAMELEFLATETDENTAYSIKLIPYDRGDSEDPNIPTIRLDWKLMIQHLITDVRKGIPPGVISARFHNALGDAALAVAKKVGLKRVILTGGCFQNKYLTERIVSRLREEQFHPYWHQRVPPNDGGIALGQVVAVARKKNPRKQPTASAIRTDESADRND